MADEELLRFSYPDLRNELDVLPAIAKEFLSPVGAHRLDAARSQLESGRSASGKFAWEVPKDEPIRTIPSEGAYEDKQSRPHSTRKRGPKVVGALSFFWELKPGPRGSKHLLLADNATTRLSLLDPDDVEGEPYAMWRMEIGAGDSPGRCFHVQVLGDKNSRPFPKSIPVPRLPCFPPTPMTCLEFLLSELFQRDWKQTVNGGSSDLVKWRGIQGRAFKGFLGWQQQMIAAGGSSPLVAMKQFPPADVLVA